MAGHRPTVRMESRYGMRQVEYRAACVCGWTEKAQTQQAAQARANAHTERTK